MTDPAPEPLPVPRRVAADVLARLLALRARDLEDRSADTRAARGADAASRSAARQAGRDVAARELREQAAAVRSVGVAAGPGIDAAVLGLLAAYACGWTAAPVELHAEFEALGVAWPEGHPTVAAIFRAACGGRAAPAPATHAGAASITPGPA